jgi:hypothetical protein
MGVPEESFVRIGTKSGAESQLAYLYFGPSGDDQQGDPPALRLRTDTLSWTGCSPILCGPELKEIRKELGLLLWAEFKKLMPFEWLQRTRQFHPRTSFENKHPKRYASLLGRTAHLAYHFGQSTLATRS